MMTNALKDLKLYVKMIDWRTNPFLCTGVYCLADYEEKYDYFESIAELYPKDNMLRHWLCGKLENEFLVELNNGRLDSAEEELNRILCLSEPDDPRALYLKGRFSFSKGDTNSYHLF